MIGDSADSSYQDLGITCNSGGGGRLVCPDRDPEEEEGRDAPEVARLEVNLGSTCAAEEYNIQEDLAIAMNLSESFSSSINTSALTTPAGVGVGVGPPAKQNEGTGDGCDTDGFSTSFTASMMEKAFADDSFCDSAKGVLYPQMQIVSDKATSQRDQIIARAVTTTAKSGAPKHCSQKKDYFLSPPTLQEDSEQCDGSRKINDRSAQKKSSRNSSGPTTPAQNDADLVPPTPPEESSASVVSPCVRRTPLRACRARAEVPHQASPAALSSHPKKERKKQKVKGKENAITRRGSPSTKKTPGTSESCDDDQQRKPAAPHATSRSDKGTASVTALSAHADSRGNDADSHGNGAESHGNGPDSHSNDADSHGNGADNRGSDADSRGNDADSCSKDANGRGNDADSHGNDADSRGNNDGADNETPLERDVPPLTQDSLCIIDVCSNAQLFAMFVDEWRSQPVYAISVACEKKPSPLLPGGGIGSNFMHGRCFLSGGFVHVVVSYLLGGLID